MCTRQLIVADTKNPSYHPGRCADIMIDGKKLGVIGQIHPLVAEGYGISGEVYVAELDFTGLQCCACAGARIPQPSQVPDRQPRSCAGM